MENITRPIIGIENRTAQEVFDIMVDRLKSAENGGWRLAETCQRRSRRMNNDERMTLRLPSLLKQKAQEEASTQDRSLSWIIIKALEQYLKGKTDER